MIEIGKRYTLYILELGDDGYETGHIGVTVTGRDGNLLEVNGSEIINLSSPLFHSLVDDEKKRANFKQITDKLLAKMSPEDKDL